MSGAFIPTPALTTTQAKKGTVRIVPIIVRILRSMVHPPFGTQLDVCFSILNSGVPFIALVFPISAFPTADVAEGLDQLDTHHILRVLIAELALESEPQRRTMRDIQWPTVQLIGQNGLGVEGVL